MGSPPAWVVADGMRCMLNCGASGNRIHPHHIVHSSAPIEGKLCRPLSIQNKKFPYFCELELQGADGLLPLHPWKLKGCLNTSLVDRDGEIVGRGQCWSKPAKWTRSGRKKWNGKQCPTSFVRAALNHITAKRQRKADIKAPVTPRGEELAKQFKLEDKDPRPDFPG